MREDGSDVGCHRTTVVGELYTGSSLCGMVVVGGEAHFYLAGWQTVVFCFVSLDKVGSGSTLEHLHQHVLIVPAIVHVKASDGEVVGVLAFSQHDNAPVAGRCT